MVISNDIIIQDWYSYVADDQADSECYSNKDFRSCVLNMGNVMDVLMWLASVLKVRGPR